MRIRAAVLEEFGAPLVLDEVDLAEPGSRGGAGPPGRLRGVPHRHVHRLRVGPLRLRPDRPRPRGRRRRRALRSGGEPGAGGRPRGDAVLAPVRRVRPLPQPADEPMPGDPRAAEPRLPAGRHDAALARRRAAAALHGHLDVRRVHGHARDRAGAGRSARRRSTAPACSRAGCPPGSARRSGRPPSGPARPAWCSAPAWSVWGPSPAAGCRAPSGSSASTSRPSAWSWRAAKGRPICCREDARSCSGSWT